MHAGEIAMKRESQREALEIVTKIISQKIIRITVNMKEMKEPRCLNYMLSRLRWLVIMERKETQRIVDDKKKWGSTTIINTRTPATRVSVFCRYLTQWITAERRSARPTRTTRGKWLHGRVCIAIGKQEGRWIANWLDNIIWLPLCSATHNTLKGMGSLACMTSFYHQTTFPSPILPPLLLPRSRHE